MFSSIRRGQIRNAFKTKIGEVGIFPKLATHHPLVVGTFSKTGPSEYEREQAGAEYEPIISKHCKFTR